MKTIPCEWVEAPHSEGKVFNLVVNGTDTRLDQVWRWVVIGCKPSWCADSDMSDEHETAELAMAAAEERLGVRDVEGTPGLPRAVSRFPAKDHIRTRAGRRSARSGQHGRFCGLPAGPSRPKRPGVGLSWQRLEKENAELRAVNDILLGIVAKAKIPCVYCGMDDISRCERGFPGCAQADDLMAGQDETFKRVCVERLELKAEAERLRALCGEAEEHIGRFMDRESEDRLRIRLDAAAKGGEG